MTQFAAMIDIGAAAERDRVGGRLDVPAILPGGPPLGLWETGLALGTLGVLALIVLPATTREPVA